VERLTLVRGEREIALDHQALRDGGIPGEAELCGYGALVHLTAARKRRLFAMKRDAAARDRPVLQRATHQTCRRHWDAVVREAHSAHRRELSHLGQLAAGLPLRDRREKTDRDLRLGARGLDERAERRGRVDDRSGVRHRKDYAVASRGGGGGARGDRLLVLAAGCAQVDVRIDEGRSKQQPIRVDDSMGIRVDPGAERGDHAVVDPNVEDRVDARHGIEGARPADDEVLLWQIPGEQHHATSRTTSVLTSTGPVVSRS
jgi:hypothetical protein